MRDSYTNTHAHIYTQTLDSFVFRIYWFVTKALYSTLHVSMLVIPGAPFYIPFNLMLLALLAMQVYTHYIVYEYNVHMRVYAGIYTYIVSHVSSLYAYVRVESKAIEELYTTDGIRTHNHQVYRPVLYQPCHQGTSGIYDIDTIILIQLRQNQRTIKQKLETKQVTALRPTVTWRKGQVLQQHLNTV